MLWAHTNTHTTHHIQEKLSYLPRFTGKHVCYSGSINQCEQILSRAGLVTHRRLCHVSQVKVCTFKVLPKCLTITWDMDSWCFLLHWTSINWVAWSNAQIKKYLALLLLLCLYLSLSLSNTHTRARMHARTQAHKDDTHLYSHCLPCIKGPSFPNSF